MMTNTNVTFPESQAARQLKQTAYKQAAADLRNNPDLTVRELIKFYKKHYHDICNEAGVKPVQKYIKRFRYEMKYLKKSFSPLKAYGYTDEQRKRSLEVRQEARWTIIERILEMKNDGFTHKQIAEQIGIHVKTISRYLKEINHKKAR
jgi:transposase